MPSGKRCLGRRCCCIRKRYKHMPNHIKHTHKVDFGHAEIFVAADRQGEERCERLVSGIVVSNGHYARLSLVAPHVV